ncbi:DUF2789 domain-containing protein [uncultured Paraglaciecola sp.]|uniref:DUF2789 domain-containing protein n=1 Tax=uncultured Paraglaciecola sp. TaxID=1765024 RepID=UPI0030DB423E|tara:strand:+ start:16587 stop:16817 length:231 start_codon:yes stop_codon:yes gene_type:complete
MYPPTHSIHSLFDQLGLESTDEAINRFVAKHGSLAAKVKLHQADFWSESQGAFLKQMTEEDADWAEIVDELDAMLR